MSGVVILLVVFFLVRREDLRDRIIRLMGKGQLTVTTQVLEDAAMRVSRYLSVLYIINAMYGIAVGIGLYAIVCILCLAARDQADGIAGMMLAQLLATAGCLVQSVSAMQAATELVNLVERCQADVVCISATPPAAVMHARHMGKDLRSRFPQPHLIVGLWNAQFDLTKAKVRIGVGDRTHVVATLAEAREQVRLLIQPLLPPPPEKQPQP